MIEWITTPGLLHYETAIAEMEARVAAIRAGTQAEAVWLVEHPPLFTGGTSAKPEDLLSARFPVHQTGRGGQYTYHGPGQRVAYVMLDLQRRANGQQADIRRYVWLLEEWIIRSLSEFGILGERRPGRIGIWVASGPADHRTENKIAAIGVRVRHGVTYHGIAINLHPDLSHYDGIIPCGIQHFGVTSIHALGFTHVTMAMLDDALKKNWADCFGE